MLCPSCMVETEECNIDIFYDANKCPMCGEIVGMVRLRDDRPGVEEARKVVEEMKKENLV